MKEVECRICGEKHQVDSYHWVHSCIGFFPLDDFEYQINKYIGEQK